MRKAHTRTLQIVSLLMMAVGLVSAALATAPQFPAFPESPKSHRWEKVGQGVYAFVGPIGITPLVSGNSMLVIGEESALVVDTGQFPSLAKAEIAGIRKLTTLPVRYIIITHWHPDHWTGNGEFERAYPGVSIVATENTRALAQSHGAADVSPEYPAKVLEIVSKALARGTHSDGKPLLPNERAYLEMAQVQFQGFSAELNSATLLFPSAIFKDSLDLYLGKRLVQVRFLGRGNTGGDAIVYVPDAKVLAAGDLVVNPFPYGSGSFYGDWIKTLQKLIAFDTQAIVPGHGPVEHDKTYVLRLIRLLQTTTIRVAEAVRGGVSLQDAQKRITLADAKAEFCAGREFQSWCESSFDGNFVQPALARIYKEQKEGPLKSED